MKYSMSPSLRKAYKNYSKSLEDQIKAQDKYIRYLVEQVDAQRCYILGLEIQVKTMFYSKGEDNHNGKQP